MSTDAQKKWYASNKTRLNKQSTEWAKNNPESFRIILRKNRLKQKFGMSLDQFEERLKAQNFGCAICKKQESVLSRNSKTIRNLNVDHDHKTGFIRGLLCNACNVALGAVGDDIEILHAAIGYLIRNK